MFQPKYFSKHELQLQLYLAQQRPHVLVQGVPLQLREEGEPGPIRGQNAEISTNHSSPELSGHLGQLLDLGHAQLLLDGEAVEEVAPEHEAVLGRVHRVDPAAADQ